VKCFSCIMTVKVVDLLCILHTCNYFSHPLYGDIFNELVDFIHVLGNRLCIFEQHYTLVVFYSPTILIKLYSICVCVCALACVLVQGCTNFP
jgi:hypothetical protein